MWPTVELEVGMQSQPYQPDALTLQLKLAFGKRRPLPTPLYRRSVIVVSGRRVCLDTCTVQQHARRHLFMCLALPLQHSLAVPTPSDTILLVKTPSSHHNQITSGSILWLQTPKACMRTPRETGHTMLGADVLVQQQQDLPPSAS